MKILLFGANGFIGSNLLKHIEGYPDVNITGVDLHESYADLTGVNRIKLDLNSENFIDNLPKDIDVILYLAQSPYYRDKEKGSLDMFNVNLKAVYKLAEFGKMLKIKKFIYASTGNVYKPTDKKLKEEDVCEPASFYAFSKYSTELMLRLYSDSYQVTIIRPFTVFGPGQVNMLVTNVIKKIFSGEEVELQGKAGIYLTPLYIKDCNNLLTKLLMEEKNYTYDVFNLAGDEEISILDIFNYTSEQTGKQLRMKMSNPDYHFKLSGDNSKIKKVFNYNFEYSFQNGLKETIKDFLEKNA